MTWPPARSESAEDGSWAEVRLWQPWIAEPPSLAQGFDSYVGTCGHSKRYFSEEPTPCRTVSKL
jgi:hypothetical protein